MSVDRNIRVIRVFEPFIMGKCRCGCNEDIPIRGSSKCLRKFKFGHDDKRKKFKTDKDELVKCACGHCDKVFKKYSDRGYKRTFYTGHKKYRKSVYKHKSGYEHVLDHSNPNSWENGYGLGHRLKLSDYLGRPLEKWEYIHHKNGIKDDNRPENLQIMTKSGHTSFHNRLKQLKIDEENRRCDNINCKNPSKTYIKKNGRPDWRRGVNGKWLCKKCWSSEQYKIKYKK